MLILLAQRRLDVTSNAPSTREWAALEVAEVEGWEELSLAHCWARCWEAEVVSLEQSGKRGK